MLINSDEYIAIVESIKPELYGKVCRGISESGICATGCCTNSVGDIIQFYLIRLRTLKDPYVFDFISFNQEMKERDIEAALIDNVAKLLLELGTGFAFLGNQYHINVGGEDFYIDMMFYNLNLRCYVVIELKTGDFKPEYAGKLNFYLSAVDDILRSEHDNPSIGLLLCKSKNNLVAEYSLKDISKPIGVSEYRITEKLPDELEKQLPSVEDIRKRILQPSGDKLQSGD